MSLHLHRVDQKKIFQKFGGHCAYCGKDLDPFDWNVDHVTAQHNGGSNNHENLVPACTKCNNCKRAMTVDGFREWLRLRCGRKVRDAMTFIDTAWGLTEVERQTYYRELEKIAQRMDDHSIVFYMETVEMMSE